ncbi:MAG: nitroreductase family protein [Bacteroidaceae bacterium]|nr:nitroreductase family protein [Bacteroidaceae bacterium]
MRKNCFLVAIIAVTLLSGCKSQKDEISAIDVIMSRTSIRSFTGDPVSREQLETILKAGMAAPSAINIQPWRFVVLTDKEKIANTFGNNPRGADMFTKAGAVIVVCGETSRMAKPFGQPDSPETPQPNMFWFEDCSAAAENILLAAKAIGLGAVWTAGYPAEDRTAPVSNALGLPENIVPLCIIPIGVPAEAPEPKDKWNPQNIHWEKW